MKKEECISKFVASLIIAFPFMAMFAFLIEIFTVETFIEISKNHGSLVAGLIGFVGIFVLVWNQNKSTKQTVDAALQAIKLESWEIEKRASKKDLLVIRTGINNIFDIGMNKKYGHNAKYEDYKSVFDEILESSLNLFYLLETPKNSVEFYKVMFIYNFFEFYIDLWKQCGRLVHDPLDIFIGNVNGRRQSALQTLEKITLVSKDDDYSEMLKILRLEILASPVIIHTSDGLLNRYHIEYYFASMATRGLNFLPGMLSDIRIFIDSKG